MTLARWRVAVALVIGVPILAGMAAGVLRPDLHALASQRLLEAIRGAGPVGWAGLAGAQVLVAASGILPASLLGIAAGAIYGVAAGFPLAAAGTLGGALLAFALSRSLLRQMIARMLARRPDLARIDAVLAQDGWRMVCLLRMSPVMPFAATSYALGMSAVGLRAYMVGTLASLPALLGYVVLGTLADAGLSRWGQETWPLRSAMLALGGAATVLLIGRVTQLSRRALAAQRPAAKP